jgi:hypothetical protein
MAPKKTEGEQFESTCNPLFQRILEWLEKIDKRLFIDNGTESIQSRLNRLDDSAATREKENITDALERRQLKLDLENTASRLVTKTESIVEKLAVEKEEDKKQTISFWYWLIPVGFVALDMFLRLVLGK